MCTNDNSKLDKLILDSICKPAFLEIDTGRIVENLRAFKSLIGSGVDILIAVKGNAYGLGAVETALALNGEGVYGFSTGSIYEAVEMREAGITRPIQIFPGITASSAGMLREHNLMPTFSHAGEAAEFERRLNGEKLKVWLKLDTGLGRFGYTLGELLEEIKYISENTRFEIDGICSHIGPVDSKLNANKDYYNRLQIERFTAAKAAVEGQGYYVPHYQLASAFATQRYPEAWFNTVCIGTSLYYAQKPENPAGKLALKPPVIALKSMLVSIKSFRPGDTCMDHVFSEKRVIGTMPIGMADGLSVANVGRDVLVRGKRYKIFAICLEHCLIDFVRDEGFELYDTVTLLGRDGDESIGLEEICRHCNYDDIKAPVVELSDTSVARAYVSDGLLKQIVINGKSIIR